MNNRQQGVCKPFKLLYIMHIDWRWVKQRPQFLAEALSQDMDVVVVYVVAWRRRLLTNIRPYPGRSYPLYHVPFRFRSRALFYLNRLLMRLQLRRIARRESPDAVWLTFPELYEFLPDSGIPIVYDCMDDNLAFNQVARMRAAVAASERALMLRADTVFVSSKELGARLKERYAGTEHLNVVLLRNAFAGPILPRMLPDLSWGDRHFVAGYFGSLDTIDWGLVRSLAERLPEYEFRFVGPAERVLPHGLPASVRIMGPVRHDAIGSVIRDWHCFIMPFSLNPLTLCVDPVKLYEYVNFARPAVATRYDEIERFAPFVSLASDLEDYVAVMRDWLKRGFALSYSDEQRVAFLSSNTWACRSRDASFELGRLQRRRNQDWCAPKGNGAN